MTVITADSCHHVLPQILVHHVLQTASSEPAGFLLVGTIFSDFSEFLLVDLDAARPSPPVSALTSCCCCYTIHFFWPFFGQYLRNGGTFVTQTLSSFAWYTYTHLVWVWACGVACDTSNSSPCFHILAWVAPSKEVCFNWLYYNVWCINVWCMMQDQWNGPYFFFLKSIAQPPLNETAPIFFSRGVFPSYYHVISDFCHIWGPFMAKIEEIVPLYWWKNPKSMIFCSRVPEQLRSRLVIFSDFGLGQPKRHFFDTFCQFWPWRGPKRDKTHL